jgi:hypothetical protein
MLVISARGRLKQEDGLFKVSLDYIARPYIKKKTNRKERVQFKIFRETQTRKPNHFFYIP